MEPDCPESGKPEGGWGTRWAWGALGVENRGWGLEQRLPHPGLGLSAWVWLRVA